MGSSDSETESWKKKGKKNKGKDKDSDDERRERKNREKEERKARMDRDKEERKAVMDRDKEERKEKMDREKEERKAKMDMEKEHRDREKEERKAKVDREKEERKERMDREKEERDREKERRDREREERDIAREEKKKHREDKKDRLSHTSPDVHDGKATSHHNLSGVPSYPSHSHSQPVHPSQSGEVPWFLREPDTEPTHDKPSRTQSDFPIQSPPPEYSSLAPQQQPFRAASDVGVLPTAQNVPPSGYRIPLGPNVQFPAPDRLGRPPATDSDGSTPVFIGSAIFPNSVHPCKIVPSLPSPCRVLYGGSEVDHHGRYDLLPVSGDMEWVPTKHGEIPPGRRPVEGGYESNGNKLYHALGFVQGIYVPGKAGQHVRGAILPFGGSEHHLQENYSILCWK